MGIFNHRYRFLFNPQKKSILSNNLKISKTRNKQKTAPPIHSIKICRSYLTGLSMKKVRKNISKILPEFIKVFL